MLIFNSTAILLMILAKERYRNHPFFISFIRFVEAFCEGANDIFQVSSNGTLNREAKTSVIILHVHSCKERQPVSHPYFGSNFKKMKHCVRRIFPTTSSFVPAHKNTARLRPHALQGTIDFPFQMLFSFRQCSNTNSSDVQFCRILLAAQYLRAALFLVLYTHIF